MIDRNKIIVWAKPREETLEEQIELSWSILKKIQQYKLFASLMIPAKSKKDVQNFEVTKKNVEYLIKANRDKKFPDIGSELVFFTSLNDEESASISFSVAKSNINLINALVISLPVNFAQKNCIEYIELFKELIILYDSYYACITSDSNLNLYDEWYNHQKNIPEVVFWINYWNQDMISNRTIKKLKSKVYECKSMYNGYYIRLQEVPVDVLNMDHIKNQKEISLLLKQKKFIF